MAWFAAALPYISAGLGALGTMQGGKANEAEARAGAREAASQGFADEQRMRRENRIAIGRQAAAVAQSGAGSGGSNELLLKQSAIFQELDALNIRYGGLSRARGLLSQAKDLKKQTPLLAGGQLLSGISQAYDR